MTTNKSKAGSNTCVTNPRSNILSCSTNGQIAPGDKWNQLLVQGSAGTNASILHEHDNKRVSVSTEQNQTEASIEHIIELPLDVENGGQNDNLLLSGPNLPYDIPSEIPLPFEENENPETAAENRNDHTTLHHSPTHNHHNPGNTLDVSSNYDSDYDDHHQHDVPPDYYLEEQTANHQNNIGFQLGLNYFDRDLVSTPIQNYPNDKILEGDTQRGWSRPFPDDMPLQGPFTARQGLNIDMATKKPEDFFNLMFDDRMFDTIADETNKYARDRIVHITNGRDPIEQIDDPSNARYNRLFNWKDVNASDIKLFMAHVIVMSLVRKSAVHSYWSRSTLSHTPFFGKHLSRNKFQTILWHLHFNDISGNPPPGCAGHDPLSRIRNVISMAQDNFKHAYVCGADVAVDESMCGFRGRVKFLQYNKSKPNKFHIKLFMASEKQTGYMLTFSVYTGSECNELVKQNAVLDPSSSVTTKTVMGLLESGNLLDMHRRIWFDNWFNSVELLLEMLSRDTYGAGTVRTNRKDLPKAVVGKSVKLKRFESVYRRNGHVLCLRWCDKRPVTMLSTIHEAVEVISKTKYNGEVLVKPVVIHDYNFAMNTVDKSDHLLSSYVALKGNKWYRKLFLHLFNMIILNSYILNKQYGDQKMSHTAFREYIANHLVTTSLPTATCIRKWPQVNVGDDEGRLFGKHFPIKFPLNMLVPSIRKHPAKRCKVCNFTAQQRSHYNMHGPKLPTKYTSFTCNKCTNIPMCITPCFEFFHSQLHFRKSALQFRIVNDM